MVMITKECPICNSTKVILFGRNSDRHYGWNKLFFDVYQCDNCKLSFLNPMITDEDLFKLYPEDYYAEDNQVKTPSKLKFFMLKLYLPLVRFYASDINIFDFQGKIVLDLGVGDGDSLIKLKSKGATVNGIEIRKDASDRCNELGLNVFNGTLLEAKYPNEYFDYIRSNHSFEHLTNPIETLREIHRILKPGGTFFVGVPNNTGLTSIIFRNHWYYLGIPFHPYNYNVKSLSYLLRKQGFSVKRTIYNGNFNGILGSIQILLNSKTGKKSNEGMFTNAFTALVFHQLARFLNMLKLGDCIEIIALKK
jgi:SAM-dependent methyltransferase